MCVRQRRRDWGRIRARIVCVVLIGALWHGPIPWIHTHRALSGAPTLSAILSWHLDHFHPEDVAGTDFGWHIHLTLPWEEPDELPEHPIPDAPSPSWVYDMPFVDSAAPSLVTVDRPDDSLAAHCDWVQPSLANIPHIDVTSLAGLHFLQTYSASVSLRALLCVARC